MLDLNSTVTEIITIFNEIKNEVEGCLKNTKKYELLSYERLQNIEILTNQYRDIVQDYSDLLNIITDVEFFVSRCNKILSLIAGNTNEELNKKNKIKSAKIILENYLRPLEVERERVKTVEMFYRSLYTRRNF